MLVPWKKSYDQPKQHIKKQKHYFADKVPHIVKAVVFPVIMYGCESWTINKASGGDGIPVELFQTLKDDPVKVLHSIC